MRANGQRRLTHGRADHDPTDTRCVCGVGAARGCTGDRASRALSFCVAVPYAALHGKGTRSKVPTILADAAEGETPHPLSDRVREILKEKQLCFDVGVVGDRSPRVQVLLER